jgi:hypothetical protein
MERQASTDEFIMLGKRYVGWRLEFIGHTEKLA